MEEWFQRLLELVPQPQSVAFADSFVFRFVEKTPQQAIIQKLARIVSGLDAAHILLLNGFTQELGVQSRIFVDLDAEIAFLSFGLLREWTQAHGKFIEYFYMEEFDNEYEPSKSSQKRPMISGDKIRAYIAKHLGSDPSSVASATRSLNKTFSGFVHSASPQIMDMYGGNPPRFHLRGMLGTPRATDHLYDLWNYYYRGVLSFSFAAHALGSPNLGKEIAAYEPYFQKTSARYS